jgi:hypothetical protein
VASTNGYDDGEAGCRNWTPKTWRDCSTSSSLFFTVSYHLRDWLLRDAPSVQADLDDLFATSKPLRLTADIANIAKHFDLTRPPRAGRQLSFAREYVPGRVGWFGFDGRLVVLSDGEKIDVLDLASEAEQAWTAFLREHGYL